MAETSMIFPATEYQTRLSRMQDEMAAQGLDALLLTNPPDIFYITGFLTRFWESPARPWYIIIPTQGLPIAVIPAIGEDLMRQTWITDIRCWPAPHPDDDGIALLRSALADCLAPAPRIGVPMGLETHLRMPLADYHKLTSQCDTAQFVDGTATLHRTREIKTEAEIGKIRDIGQIAGRAFARVKDFASAGAPLEKVYRQFQMALLEEGADWVSYVAGAAAQNGYGNVISPATEAPLQNGDVLMLDTGAVKDGYFCDYDRNYFIGPPSPAAERCYHALWEVTEEALATLRPGMTARDAHQILAGGLAACGLQDGGGRLGHGLGLSLTEWPSFIPEDITELREGMVLTLEPSAYVDEGKILVHEENIVLRAEGPELLSVRAPYDGPVI